jgi:predicted RNA-binding protein YlxR (DUF448 family)
LRWPLDRGVDVADTTVGSTDTAETDEVIRVRVPRTPEQEQVFLDALDRHRGQWVAVENDQIVAAAASLAELRKLIEPRSDAMVFEVDDVPRGEALILGVA